jgi:hypothetical protein
MKSLIFIAILFLPLVGHSQVVSETGFNTTWQRFKEGLVFNHFSIFTGPGVATGGSNQIGRDGQVVDRPIKQWFQLTLGKKLNKNITFAVNPRFTLNYGAVDANEQAEIDDPVTGFIFNYQLSKNVSYFGIVNTVTGKVSKSAKDDNLVANPGDFHEVTYTVSPKFDVALRTFFRMNIYSRNENRAAYGGWIGPKTEYYFNDKTSLRFWMQQGFKQVGTNNNFFSTRDDGQDLFFSLHQKIHKTLGILPYIAFNTADSYSTNNAYLGAWMYGSFF